MIRAPRPRVKKLNDQRMRTSRRFWKPIRYQRWTTSHVIQAGKPLRRIDVEVGDRPGAADRREVALVAVAERPDRLARVGGRGRLGRVAALLHRDRRDARVDDGARHLAPRTRTMSPSASTSGWPGRVRSGSTATRPARSSSAPVSSPSWAARPDAVDAGGPDHGARRDALGDAVRALRP